MISCRARKRVPIKYDSSRARAYTHTYTRNVNTCTCTHTYAHCARASLILSMLFYSSITALVVVRVHVTSGTARVGLLREHNIIRIYTLERNSFYSQKSLVNIFYAMHACVYGTLEDKSTARVIRNILCYLYALVQ